MIIYDENNNTAFKHILSLSHTHTPINTQISSSCDARRCRCSPEALPSSSAPDSPSAHQTPNTQTQSSEVERERERKTETVYIQYDEETQNHLTTHYV